MGYNNFEKDLDDGKTGELVVRKYIEAVGFVFDSDNNDYKYDLKMYYPPHEKYYTYEIKTDGYTSGNIVFEFECRNKPSGIATTEADYFVTYFKNYGIIWNIKTSKLKLLLQTIKPTVKEGVGDYGSKTKVYLYKMSDIAEFFTKYKL